LRTDFLLRVRRRVTPVLAITFTLAVSVQPASAGIFDFLFGAENPSVDQKAKPAAATQASPFAGPGDDRPAQAPPPPISGGYARSTGHCVRMCDGMHFPVHGRGEMSPTAMCQAFCPASVTKVFFGNNVDRAISMDGERYSEIATAYAYRKKLSSDCTCNGREPAGLAPVDISLDTTLRQGDVVATTGGFVAYAGTRSTAQPGEFTPVASYGGLNAATRAQLGDAKVAPVHADVNEDTTASIEAARIMSTAKPRASLN
jgi:hypothetical protein